LFRLEHSSKGDENRQAPVGIPRFNSLRACHLLLLPHARRAAEGPGTMFPENSLGRISRIEKRLVLDRERAEGVPKIVRGGRL
jgi:hypothetical protein